MNKKITVILLMLSTFVTAYASDFVYSQSSKIEKIFTLKSNNVIFIKMSNNEYYHYKIDSTSESNKFMQSQILLAYSLGYTNVRFLYDRARAWKFRWYDVGDNINHYYIERIAFD